MATKKRVFTLRLEDEIFDKIGIMATRSHRSMTNYIEFVLLQHINDYEAAGRIIDDTSGEYKEKAKAEG